MLSIAKHQGSANQNHTEISLYTSHNDYHQKEHKYQILKRIQRNGTPHTLLVEMSTGAATMQKYGDFSKTKNNAIGPSNSTPGYMLKNKTKH